MSNSRKLLRSHSKGDYIAYASHLYATYNAAMKALSALIAEIDAHGFDVAFDKESKKWQLSPKGVVPKEEATNGPV